MSTTDTPEPRAGAFDKDRQFGNRLDRTFALNEPFLLLGAKRTGGQIDTAYGPADVMEILAQKLNHETGNPQGQPIRVNTVLSAVVEKLDALTEEELHKGPIVQLEAVPAKSRGGRVVTVLSLVRFADEDQVKEFGASAADVGRATDLTRPEGERIPI